MRACQCDPQIEINGQQALAFVSHMNVATMRPALERHHLTSVDPMQWYPLQTWLDVLNEMAKRQSASLDYVAMGTAMAQMVWLPGTTARLSLETFFLTALSQVYRTQYRNGDAGSLEVVRSGTRRLRVKTRTPYPDDLIYGLVYGFALRFLPAGTPITVEYEASLLRRDQGGNSTTLIVAWD